MAEAESFTTRGNNMDVWTTPETKNPGTYESPAKQRRVLPHDAPSLLLQAACSVMVVVDPLSGGVATARIKGVRFQVERRVLVFYHLIPRPRTANEDNR